MINRQIKEIQSWDSNFSKNDFMEGAKNAAVTISSMLQQSDWKELRGLLNRDALVLKYILEKIFIYFVPLNSTSRIKKHKSVF